ncbi:hypothetical protein GLOIN_2v1848933 [Rhizophagus irregularis DAOM 181602=DAOM 197198]|uniref:Uncharacterized protein n=1 Tax=Rhizophagus irregularis (strain DAOM 181602 / DAOM 197198 / MUCL 43194) TaxID=747089 RepID=A0A2P4NY96_RHIID|nr:hypothetical protein GLOIN_2v1848933 [Rhizophagus irregularis DAOM 181602=DAOM 197198]POG58110.1 hypothetical protein GLOIN_2v1848933 [Rhizophagus irregularis DAOM 181602=DAOM 197198]|eukprot:XP_025164976.1 hypothetical protein GLOIN_2v1848933 [Rhizophagus irregularis DAOM 181602=DAOM 197198]
MDETGKIYCMQTVYMIRDNDAPDDFNASEDTPDGFNTSVLPERSQFLPFKLDCSATIVKSNKIHRGNNKIESASKNDSYEHLKSSDEDDDEDKTEQVNESIKCIVPEHVVSIESTDNQFSNLFDAVTSGEYGDREVKVFIRREKSENWKEVDNGLKGNLEIYYQGNYLGTINYVWRILENEEQNETLKARMLARINKELPHYFTRQMRKNVLNKYSYIRKVTPAVLRMLHFDLTGNAAVTSDAISHDVEKRLRLMLSLADPNIIFDLRTNNGFKGTKFNVFWDEMDAYFNEQNLLAVDERRHGTILYMPLALSVRDLREIITGRLKINYNDPLPSTIYIPSDEWIRLQFCPTNATTTRSMHHTSQFNVKFKSICDIDPTLTIKETTQAQIRHHSALIKFMDAHCRTRAYSFQIKKCNNITCSYCKPIHLPSSVFNNLNFLPDPIPSRDNTDHYMPFQNVYGTETTEEYRPTYMQSQANAEPIPKSILIGGKIRGYIDCEDCRKRRCVYSDRSMSREEQEDYQQALDSYSYSCGAPIFLIIII